MDNQLWEKIVVFDFDHPISEYGFSVRLGTENYWTADFTKNAIMEYKKFMYLAATSEMMVSPSEIIDVVWHEHLIFTKSYTAFCELLGKRIEHIPSTHNPEDSEKFHAAKERTNSLYEIAFGPQPKAYWNYSDMYAQLSLEKSKIKLRSFMLCGLLAIFALWIPSYFLLKPIYIHIQNPDFTNGIMMYCMAALIFLEFFNRYKLRKIVSGFDRESFIFNLNPNELVYLQTGKITKVADAIVNKMILENKIEVLKEDKLRMVNGAAISNPAEFSISATIKNSGKIYYSVLLRHLQHKPGIGVVGNAMEAFKKYFTKSQFFGKLFYLNFGILSFIFLLGLVRISTGIVRGKEIFDLSIIMVLFFIISALFLNRLTDLIATTIIPDFYKRKVINYDGKAEDSEWSYFLLGNAAFAASFLPLVTYRDKSGMNSTCGSDSGGGSGCGSSCGGCGGCGGD